MRRPGGRPRHGAPSAATLRTRAWRQRSPEERARRRAARQAELAAYAKRNAALVGEVMGGATLDEVAERYRLSTSRVRDLVQRAHGRAGGDPDASITAIRGRAR